MNRPGPALRANSYPKVANLVCRLPLLTLMDEARGYTPRRPDAVMSTVVRGAAAWRVFKLVASAQDTGKAPVLFESPDPFSE